MSRKNSRGYAVKSVSLRYSPVFLLYAISFLVLFKSFERGDITLWIILVGITLISGLCMSIFPLRQNNWRLLVTAFFLSLCVVIMLVDGYEAENGFLFDGLDTLLYLAVVPLVVLICLGIFVINSKSKLNGKSLHKKH